MDVREKLVELLTDNLPRCGNLPSWDNPLQLSCDEQVQRIADHLIMNGVTVQDNTEISNEFLKQLRNAPVTILQEEPTIEAVQEWISVKDRLPKVRKAVLVVQWETEVDIAWYDKDKGCWQSEFVNAYDDGEITYWMPLPQPPKGE